MADPLRSLLDRVELDELMNRDAASIDWRDWARLRTVFVDGDIEADFTSMGVRQVFRGPADDWVARVRQTITGLDATQHLLANHSTEIEGDRARDTRYMQARHQLGDARYTIGGRYTGQMARTAAAPFRGPLTASPPPQPQLPLPGSPSRFSEEPMPHRTSAAPSRAESVSAR